MNKMYMDKNPYYYYLEKLKSKSTFNLIQTHFSPTLKWYLPD